MSNREVEEGIIKISGPANGLKGEITVPGDKSISHRAVMMGAISEGITEVENLSTGEDPWNTARAMGCLGADIRGERSEGKLTINGVGLRGFKEPGTALDAGNAGTMMRLLSGILAGQPFESVISGDEYLSKRPMKRIIEPLRLMGAEINGVDDAYPPLRIRGGDLKPIEYENPIPSAQVKSCILLAGLYADGRTTVIDKARSRDHTERMLKLFGASVESGKTGSGAYFSSVEGWPKLKGREITIPGDISSASFFMVAAAIVPDSEVVIRGIGLNPTRLGIISVLKRMGAKVSVENQRSVSQEPVGDVVVKASKLNKARLAGEIIPNVIDEIPVIAVAATCASGEVLIRDAEDLRNKETDRIKAVVDNLRRLGAKVGELQDGMVIEGGYPLYGAELESYGDHRIAMAFSIAALVAEGETSIKSAEWADTSFPGFFDVLASLREG